MTLVWIVGPTWTFNIESNTNENVSEQYTMGISLLPKTVYLNLVQQFAEQVINLKGVSTNLRGTINSLGVRYERYLKQSGIPEHLPANLIIGEVASLNDSTHTLTVTNTPTNQQSASIFLKLLSEASKIDTDLKAIKWRQGVNALSNVAELQAITSTTTITGEIITVPFTGFNSLDILSKLSLEGYNPTYDVGAQPLNQCLSLPAKANGELDQSGFQGLIEAAGWEATITLRELVHTANYNTYKEELKGYLNVQTRKRVESQLLLSDTLTTSSLKNQQNCYISLDQVRLQNPVLFKKHGIITTVTGLSLPCISGFKNGVILGG